MSVQAQPSTWSVRQVEESPMLQLEGFQMHRILEGSGFEGVGCEYVVLEPGRELEPHIHKKGHAIILVLRGSGQVMVGNRYYPLRANTVINIPPGTEHGLVAGDEELVVYGFQVPAIIDENDEADIFFTRDSRKGEVSRVNN